MTALPAQTGLKRLSTLQTPGLLALVTLSYFAAAKLGLLLSLPSGFASPLWPASGVAFYVVLRFGYRSLAGIALGSLASNLTAGANGAAVLTWPDWHAPWLSVIALALGAATQAGVGVWLIQRLLRDAPPGAFRVWALLRLMFRAGLLACLINALIAALVLPSLAGQDWQARLPVALVWWVGDALGVLGLMPLVLFRHRAASEDAVRYSLQEQLPGLVALTIAALSWPVTAYLGHLQNRNIESRESLQIAELRHHLQVHLDRSVLMVETFHAFYQGSERVLATEFEQFAKPWLASDESITAIGWVPRIEASERAAFEAGLPGMGEPVSITERGPANTLIAALPRDSYWPLTLLTPNHHNRARGFDLASEPMRREALTRALARDGVVATSRVQLADRFGSDEVSIVLMRRINAEGRAIITGALRLNRLVEAQIASFDNALPVGTRIRLLDTAGLPVLDHRLLADGRISLDDSALPQGVMASLPLTVADRRWQLDIHLPSQNDWLIHSVSWWLGQVMPQLFAVVLGLALINGALRQSHTQRLQDDLNQLATAQSRLAARQGNAGNMLLRQTPHDSAIAQSWAQSQWQPDYAPVVDLETGLLRAVDCQLHWPEAPAGVNAAMLADWAARNGQSAASSMHLLQAVLGASRSLPLRRGDAFSFALPVSSSTLATPGWVMQLLELLAAQRLPGRRLSLEIQESDFVTAGSAAIDALHALRDAGVRVALHGLGTGHSALTALRSLPVDRIRLDPVLVADIAHDSAAREIVRTLIQLAAALQIEVIADGVHSAAIASTLHDLACKAATGSVFASLDSIEAVAQVLTRGQPLWPAPPSLS
ncbi:MAG: EAL domain-containing protein [Pseudomonadota bacterium]